MKLVVYCPRPPEQCQSHPHGLVRCARAGPERAHLRRDDHLVADPPLLHPLPEELLRGLVLVVVRGVDEVSAGFIERVKELEARLLVHRSHARALRPLVSNAHRPEADGRDVDAGCRREQTVATELGLRLGRWCPKFGGRHVRSG